LEPKKSNLPAFHPARGSTQPRPQLVFARDDDLGSRKSPTHLVRILVVEDDYLIASEMEHALTKAGYRVTGIAASAEEALELAAAEHPALAVMDIRLGGKRDGIDAALELFARHRIRCIFATAHQTAEARERARPANPLAWVPKPYSMSSLVEVVRRVLRDLQGGAG